MARKVQVIVTTKIEADVKDHLTSKLPFAVVYPEKGAKGGYDFREFSNKTGVKAFMKSLSDEGVIGVIVTRG